MAKSKAEPRVVRGVWDHPKVQRAAENLQVTTYQIVYHLYHLWDAAHKNGGVVTQAGKGEKPSAVMARIASAAKYDGQPGQFTMALLNANLIEQRQADIIVHDWKDWNAEDQKKASAKSDGADNADGDGPSGPIYSQFIWWLQKGYAEDYKPTGYDGRHIKGLGTAPVSLLAECYVSISRGRFGDDYDRRCLSVSHAIRKVNAFKSWKTRRGIIGPAVELTPEGARYYGEFIPGGQGGGVAGAPTPEAPRRDNPSRPSPSREYLDSLANHPKVLARRDQRAREEGIIR